jgi:hypothetical protein
VLSVRRFQSHDLERPIAVAHDARQSLRPYRLGITYDGNLSRLGKDIRQRL